jgi:transcription antitermination factor NusG
LTAEPRFWCALQVAPRHEAKVVSILATKGFERLLPTYKVRRNWSDRVKLLDLPLFPGYVFCRITRESVGAVLQAPSITRIVSFGGRICPIDDHEIAALQQIVESGVDALPTPYVRVGERVQIKRGPLAGISGTLTSVMNHWRLIVSVELLVKSISVSVSADEIDPIPNQTTHADVTQTTASAIFAAETYSEFLKIKVLRDERKRSNVGPS